MAVAPAAWPGLPVPRRYQAIAALCFGTALVILDGAIATVALPTIARDLNVAPSAAVLIVTVYQLTLVMLLLPLSALGDRIGHRTLYQRGQVIFAVATLLCFFAKSLPFLLVARAGQAIGAACALSVSSALVRTTYPASHLGRGLGINSVIVSSAGALAPTIGGLVLAVAPWPWVFASALPFAVLSLALGRALPDPRPIAEPYDVLGAVLCAASFGLTIGGIESMVHGDSPVVGAAVLAAGLICTWRFVMREKVRARPIMPVDLLGRPVFALSSLGALAAFTASMTLIVAYPFRLTHVFGFSATEVGALMAPWPLTTLVVAPLAGALSDKVPAGLLGGIGMALATTALLLLAYVPPDPSAFDLAWRMSLCGAGFGLFLSPNARLIIGSAPRERAASAGGLIATTRITGQALGATVAAVLLSLMLDDRAPPLVAAGLAVVAGLCSLARLRPSIRLPAREELPAPMGILPPAEEHRATPGRSPFGTRARGTRKKPGRR